MRAHGLMQAIARVNRVFKDKPGGLVVDYLGVAQELKHAMATYTESGGKGKTAIPQEEAVSALVKHYEVCLGLFHGFDWTDWTTGSPAQKLSLLPNAQEHILKQEDGKRRLTDSRGPNRGVKLDRETELAIVVGRAMQDITAEEAAGHIFGYVCASTPP
jgi:type I site-specific restriction-modification system R (restriction) subunit